MMADPTKSYWGTNVGHLDGQIQEGIGKRNWPIYNPNSTALLRLLQKGERCEKMNAIQFFQHLSGSPTHCDTKQLKIAYISCNAPLEPNVYTDGAMACPKNQFWSLMGVGLWWPERTYLTQPLSDLEKKFVGKGEENLEGVSLWGCMSGHQGSSTRAEIAAIVVALMSSVPVHIATDSANAKNGLEKLKHSLRHADENSDNELYYEEWPMGKHWSLINDGDLWHQVWTLLVQRGLYSVAVTKVKGHAKEEQVKGNADLEIKKKGNDKADKAADDGMKMHGEGIEDLAKSLASRH